MKISSYGFAMSIGNTQEIISTNFDNRVPNALESSAIISKIKQILLMWQHL